MRPAPLVLSALFALAVPWVGAAPQPALEAPETALTAQQLLGRGAVHEEAGRLDDAAVDYRAALAAAKSAGDRSKVVAAHIAYGYLQYYRGDLEDALVHLREGHAIAVELGEKGLERTALSNIAHVYADARIGEYDRAIGFYEQALAQHEAAIAAATDDGRGHRIGVADTLFNIASTHERKGDLERALEWYHRALAAEQALARLDQAAYVRRSIGVTLGKLKRSAEALRALDAALAELERLDEVETAMMTRQSRGIVLRQLGRLPEAIADLEASRRWFEANRNPRFLEKSEDELASAYAEAGRWREAFEARTRHATLQRALAEKLGKEDAARLRVKFDTERTEQENLALLRDKAAADRIRTLQSTVLGMGAVILVVLAVFAVRVMFDRRRLRDLAMTDDLTRLPNRRHLLTVATDTLRRCRREGKPLTLIALDLDHFKQVNDAHGHAAGDKALRQVAHACRMALRPTDAFGRTGGEEFIAVLPETTEADALAVAERLRAAVEALDLGKVAPGLRMSLSLGVAAWDGAESLARLVSRADARLYQAKDAGRNRVMPAVG